MTKSIQERVLRPNKLKFFLFALIFLAFFLFSLYMIFFYPRIDGKVMGGGLSLLISAGVVLLAIAKAPVWKATMILKQEGIFINNLPKQNKRLIRWNEIKSISTFNQQVLLPRFPYITTQKYLVIYLNNSTEGFSTDKQNVFFGKRYKEMRQGKQILIPINFLPYYSLNKNLRVFQDYPIKID